MNRDQLREAVLGTAAWSKAGLVTESAAPAQEAEVISESKVQKKEVTKVHACPLCESVLEEELSDEVLLEHAEQMLSTFQEAEQIIAEAEEAEEGEELDEEEEVEEVDLLEGLDEEDIQTIAEMCADMKKKKKGKKAY